jgi:hypothetical protein
MTKNEKSSYNNKTKSSLFVWPLLNREDHVRAVQQRCVAAQLWLNAYVLHLFFFFKKNLL